MKKIISWLILLYFLILAFERVQSLVRIGRSGGQKFFETSFDGFVNVLAIISILATLVLLTGFNGGFWKSLFDSAAEINYSVLTVTVGVMLVSGMVHTEFTLPPVQFVSYGFLIAAMVLRTVQISGTSGSRFMLWYSLVYLTVFSMAIPVMYHSHIKLSVFFHIIEAVAALILVACFTFMLRKLFLGQGRNLLYWTPIILVAVLDTVLILMRRKESLNVFVLIFEIASIVLFAVGKFLK